ncbi:ribBA [Symbiodinium sp. CCMP2456]|nr:ribBA [Symbiodinium sp. CCMP2456]
MWRLRAPAPVLGVARKARAREHGQNSKSNCIFGALLQFWARAQKLDLQAALHGEHVWSRRSFCRRHVNGSADESAAVVEFVARNLRSMDSLPAVTLTYAQSLDGSIAAAGNERVLISGQQSMAMTHRFRTMHDAILIGVGTLLADDPQLTARLVPGQSPLPVVLDSRLRSPVTSRLVAGAADRAAARAADGAGLVIVTTENDGCVKKQERYQALASIPGVRLLAVPERDGYASLQHTLNALRKQFGCDSLMVEGGRAVIASFLTNPQLVTSFVATLSPKFLGGLGPSANLQNSRDALMSLHDMRSCTVGEDIVVYGAPAGDGKPSTRIKAASQQPEPAEHVEHVEHVSLRSSCRMWIEAIDDECEMKVYSTSKPGQEIVALIKGQVAGAEAVPVRVHSECFTGDVLGSKRCDCGPQLHSFLHTLHMETRGVLLYIRGDEGRGIGLVDKIRAYELQEKGLDTVDANLSLGLAADLRTFEGSRKVLEGLGVRSIRLYTNNPEKVEALQPLACEVCPMNSTPNEHNMDYLLTKRNRMNHRTLLSELATDKAPAPSPQVLSQDRPF